MKGRITFSLQLPRILAGKLNEAYQVITKYFLKSKTGHIYREHLTKGEELRLRSTNRISLRSQQRP